ncbi:Diacylglycerol kinase [Sulfitobacter noctilucae]|uniref:diacylglycerol kinase n=1 Tax=Sulfitobacter noctilucae TaxID=1342302 RepID=UPI000469EEE3|nr:diacylglycerol kinase [Sulfitobacter noctilucae]KIN74953.1 Diacylglycerol kinase [Sulfitobacter noctilucae]
MSERKLADVTPERPAQPKKPDRTTGVAHVFAAAGYSAGGLRRLWQETAFRHITLILPVSALLFAFAGAGLMQYVTLLILFLALVAVEALNTAIECLVDHLAPDWQLFARDAKDLGSLATLCLLLATGVYVLAVLGRALFLN